VLKETTLLFNYFSGGRQESAFKCPPAFSPSPLSHSVKDETEHKNRDKKMTSQRTKQHICKPQRSSQNFGLQKSCFFANARTPEQNRK